MKTLALLAEFESPAALLNAAEKLRDEGYRRFDCHSPFPVHGMDEAMGLKQSPIGFIVGVMTVIGASIGFGLQTWVTTDAYPLVFSGKPLFSWQAYIIVTFALFVLFGALGAVIGMFHLNGLPRLHHPLFYSDRFRCVSDNGFMVSITADDEMFDPEKASAFLVSIGAVNIELVRGE